MAVDRRRLTREQQIDRDLVIALSTLRFRRTQRGRRWMHAFAARRRWLR